MSRRSSTSSNRAAASPANRRRSRAPTVSIESDNDLISSVLSSSDFPPAVAEVEEFPASPTQLARRQEKNDLADLNKRLELYILRQRERDASQNGIAREIEAVRSKASEDLGHLKEFYQGEIEGLRENLDKMQAQHEKAQEKWKSREEQWKSLEKELKAQQALRAQSDLLIKQKSQDFIENQGKLNRAQQENEQFSNQNKQLKEKSMELEKSLHVYRERSEAAQQEAAALRHQMENLREDFINSKTQSQQEIAQQKEQILWLHKQRSQSETVKEKQFESRLLSLYQEKTQQLATEKENAIAELKMSYDEKIYGYRVSLEQLGHELEYERSNRKKCEFSLQEQAETIAGLEKERNSMKKQILALQNELEKEKENPEFLKILQEKQEIIRRIKASFKRKDQEFDELMDVKIMLDMEIRAYRGMLEAEEARLGYSPIKKRRREGIPVPIEILNENLQTSEAGNSMDFLGKFSASSPLIISGMDLEGDYITVRNNSTEEIGLQGWHLASRINGKQWEFPKELKLKAGAGVTVLVGTHEKRGGRKLVEVDGVEFEKDSSHGLALRWSDSRVWHNSGDQILLIHPHGEPVAAAEILPNSSSTGSSIEGEDLGSSYSSVLVDSVASPRSAVSSGDSSQAGNCLLM